MRSVCVFIGFLLITFSAAGLGGLFTANGVRDWYPTLHKPAWNPPGRVFGPVWTFLYCCIAVAGYLTWRKAGFAGCKWTMLAFAVQLVLNAAWSGIFFGMRQPGWAFAEIVLLWAAILVTMVGVFRISVWPGALLLPYLLWVSFASVLNLVLWRMNIAGTT